MFVPLAGTRAVLLLRGFLDRRGIWRELRDPDASLLHYTIGGPWFKEYEGTEYAADWFAEKERMLASTPRVKVAAAS